MCLSVSVCGVCLGYDDSAFTFITHVRSLRQNSLASFPLVNPSETFLYIPDLNFTVFPYSIKYIF